MKRRNLFLTGGLLLGLLLVLMTGALAAMAASDSVTALPVIDDYENPAVIASMFSYGDGGTSVNKSAVATDTVPGAAAGNQVLQVDYVSVGWGAGTGRDIPSEDWSSADGLRFWFKGDGSGVLYRLILSDNGDPNAGGDTSERFAYEWNDSVAGWRFIQIPWSLFFRDPGFQPGGAPNDGLTLTAIKAYAFALPTGNSKTIFVDDMRLYYATDVDDFQNPAVADALFSYGDGGTSVAKSVVATDTVPGAAAGNSVLKVDYVSVGWGAGFGHDIPGADWSATDGLSFWFKGNGSGALYRVILSDNGDPNAGGDTSERFAYEWNDTSAGWRLVSIPWSLFFRDPGFQPGGAPNDGLTLTAVRAYAIALPSGNNATIHLDGVHLFGGPVDLLVGFAVKAVNVDEGGAATLDVSLNMTTTVDVGVSYATADGSATAGSDYVASSGVITIPAGSLAVTLTVATVDDAVSEEAETISVTLSAPVNAGLTSATNAVITIADNDVAPVTPGGHSEILETYEYTSGLPSGVDGDGVAVGYVTWSHDNVSSAITLTVPSEQRPGAVAGNQVMQLDLNLVQGKWGGFSHNFENAAQNEWVSQDWSRYAGVSFWLYGNNTGGVIFLDIMDNRNPGATSDDAERWSVDIPDNFNGWKYIEIPFANFNRKDIGNGAPNDGFNKDAVHGYGIGGFSSAPMLNQIYYIDNLGLIPRTTGVDDYEYTAGLPNGADGDGVAVGYVTWSHDNVSSAITLTVPSEQRPGAAAGNQVMQLDLNLIQGKWGGFSHNFENAAQNEWVSQDWSTYEGVCFWLYGNNTGGVIFLDIMDNRNPGATSDDAERWSVDVPDNFNGWKFIQIPFANFNRKDIGNGAPNDGFNKDAVHGYGIGGFSSAPMLDQSYYIDDFTIYGNTGSLPQTLQVAFAAAKTTVIEGATAAMTVSLNMSSTAPVTLTYKSMESQATPNRDFTPVSGTLVFAPGVTAQVITVPTMDDAKHETSESVAVNLYDPQGAEFGFLRRAILTIDDNDAADVAEVDDVELAQSLNSVSGVALSRTELAAGDPNALPGQGAYEQVLTVQYDDAATTPNAIRRTFAAPQDWSGYEGLSFWYFGNNTGDVVHVNLLENQITQTQEMSSTNWVLRWADEFDGAAGAPPNPNNWKYEVGDGALNGIPGWGNSEFEYYSTDPANASTDGNGNLVLSVKALDANNTDLVCYYGPCRYTSARLLTQDRTHFQYGKIEARIKLPPTDQSGLWPAFWALGTNITDPKTPWPLSGEIDIMEYVSRVPNEVFGTLHGPGYSGGASYGQSKSIDNLLADFHTYSVEWSENHVVWYVDGIKYHEARNTDAFLAGKEWVYNHPFFLLLNVAIGGNFGGTISDQLTLPQDTLVDYVRVYQAADEAERFEASFMDSFTGWKQIFLPFTRFSRSATQPAAAPNDGLTLTEVNGYGFTFPSAASGPTAQAMVTTHIDQVWLEVNIDTPTAIDVTAEPTAPHRLQIYLPTVIR